MISRIIKQIWNQRRMNVWIFLELVIAGFFLWTVIDPVYVFMTYGFEDKGYKEKDRYIMRLGGYYTNHGMRDTTVTVEQQKKAFLRMAQLVREQPEVESMYIPLENSFPNSPGISGGQFFPDTLTMKEEKYTHAQQYLIKDEAGNNFFHTLEIKDALTGEELQMPADATTRNLCFVSELFAQKMFGTTQVVGKKVYTYNNQTFEINGVFKNIKARDYATSYPLIIRFNKDFPYWGSYAHTSLFVVFRLKEGVDFDAFNNRFKSEVAPHMNQANLYFKEFQAFKDLRKNLGKQYGLYNNLRLKFSLAAFTLLCIFLGMVGTFWIRCNARRQEIGLMRSMGASKNRIITQFLVESGILLTAAFIISLVVVFNVIFMQDAMTQPTTNFEKSFALISEWLSPVVQFGMVSLLTYLALLLIAVIGTAIPVSRATKVLPADALRDE